MTRVTIKINERTKAGKAFIAILSDTFSKNADGVEIVETDSKKLLKEKSIYSPEFIEKVKKAEENIRQGKTTRLDLDDIWGSIL
jgi:hypothetical protein